MVETSRHKYGAKYAAALLALAVMGFSAAAQAQQYTQAASSTLTFAGHYQGQVFTGNFPGFSTDLRFDPQRLNAARLHVVIPLATATTGNSDYDGEMRGKAFFDSARFPQATYTASKFRALGGNRYAADGILALRGVSKPVTLTFTWTPGARPVLAGTASVRRLDFGVGGGDWADTKLIPNAIAISTRVNFVAAKPAAAAYPASAASASAANGQSSSVPVAGLRSTGTRVP